MPIKDKLSRNANKERQHPMITYSVDKITNNIVGAAQRSNANIKKNE